MREREERVSEYQYYANSWNIFKHSSLFLTFSVQLRCSFMSRVNDVGLTHNNLKKISRFRSQIQFLVLHHSSHLMLNCFNILHKLKVSSFILVPREYYRERIIIKLLYFLQVNYPWSNMKFLSSTYLTLMLLLKSVMFTLNDQIMLQRTGHRTS